MPFFVHAENDINGEIGTPLISATVVNIIPSLVYQEVNPELKKSIIQGFCNAVHPSSAKGFSLTTIGLANQKEFYISDQSVFLYMLCDNDRVKLVDDYFRDFTKEAIKKDTSFKTLKFQKACQKEYKDECNVAQL